MYGPSTSGESSATPHSIGPPTSSGAGPRAACHAPRVRVSRSPLGLVRSLGILAALASLGAPAAADDWPAPHPRGWHGPGFGRVIEVFPPNSRHNPGDRPLAYAYEIASTSPRIDAKLLWKVPLANRYAPYEAIVSSDGWLVTLDEWAGLGFDHAIAVYDPAGKLIKTHKLDGLVPADVANRDRSKSSRYWRKGAQYVFDTKAKLLQIHLAKAGVVEVSLATGDAQYVTTAKARRVASPEIVMVYELDLRFASVTDVLAERARAAPPPATTPKRP